MLPKLSSAGALLFLHGRRRLAKSLLRSLSTAISAPPKPHFMVDYLISSCGFSSAEALKASQRLSHLESTRKPDSVLGFLRSHGFNDAHLRKIISRKPRLLCCDVDKTLKPKFQSLRGLGFSDADLTLLLTSYQWLLHYRIDKMLPRIRLWESLLGSREHLTKLLKSNRSWFLGRDIESTVKPNISQLRGLGISDQKIAMVLRKTPGVVIQSPERFRSQIERVESLGIPHSSGMFVWALYVVCHVSAARFDGTKQLLMRSFGWSEEEFVAAFRKAPVFLTVSREMLSRKLDFLMKQIGCKPSELSQRPVLLMLSLERRLIPRHRVLQVLGSRGLLRKEYNTRTYMFWSDAAFMEKFVSPYKDKVSGLKENFMASCGRGEAL